MWDNHTDGRGAKLLQGKQIFSLFKIIFIYKDFTGFRVFQITHFDNSPSLSSIFPSLETQLYVHFKNKNKSIPKKKHPVQSVLFLYFESCGHPLEGGGPTSSHAIKDN